MTLKTIHVARNSFMSIMPEPKKLTSENILHEMGTGSCSFTPETIKYNWTFAAKALRREVSSGGTGKTRVFSCEIVHKYHVTNARVDSSEVIVVRYCSKLQF